MSNVYTPAGSSSVPWKLMKDSTNNVYVTTPKSNSVMSPSFSTTLSNGVVRLGTTKPVNCTNASWGFASIAGGTKTVTFDIEQLPQTINLETLLATTLTTAAMPVSGFSFYSWNAATSTAIELESRLGFLQAQGKNLVLSAAGASAITDDIIKIDNFFGCVEDVTPFLTTQN